MASSEMVHIKPLGFHRVMENNPIAAYDSPLFKCPTEVLVEIVDYLSASPTDLASLAMVNSDCRQLARSWQFRKLTFDATPRSSTILATLLSETLLRRQGKLGLSLGACIRHIETTNNGYWARIDALRPRKPGFASDDHSDEAYDEDEARMEEWRRAVGVVAEDTDLFHKAVRLALTSLPHLYTLNPITTTLDQTFLDWLLSFKTVRHLINADFNMDAECPRAAASTEWPLETLDITLSWEFQYGCGRKDLDASQYWYHFLRPCAPTLQSLTLSYQKMMGAIDEKSVSFDLNFPLLRHLRIQWLDQEAFDTSSLKSLVLSNSWLSSLSFDFRNKKVREILQNAGQMPQLQTLILNNTFSYHSEVEKTQPVSLSFLNNTPRLTAFVFKLPTKPRLLERALSKLSRSQLTKLSMFWEGKEHPETDHSTEIQQPSTSEIPQTSLCALSNMVALEELHLDCVSTKRMNVWMRDWYVEHNALREYLGPSLCKLKRLALTHDIYRYHVPRFPGMPADMPPVPGLPSDTEWAFTSYSELRSEQVWWEIHSKHMREQAVQYAQTFLQLEFVHLGECSFVICRDQQSNIVLSETERPDVDFVFDWEL